jgi:phage/plasmid-like protein (TIGR03299 family)
MSNETSEWLNTMTLIGCTDKRGQAWHYRASSQGAESNHYDGFIPVDDVIRRLFNFQVISQPVFITNPVTGEMTEVPNKRANVCSDNGDVLGVFSSGYTGHDYKTWLLDSVATLLHGDLGIANAGLLRNRGVAFVQVEVSENFMTPDGVEFRPNMLACTSYDGSIVSHFNRCFTNVVCDNTMSAGLSEKAQAFKVKHSRNSQLRLGDAREALGLILTSADSFTEQVNRLCATTVTPQQWESVLNALVPMPEEDGSAKTRATNKRDVMWDLWRKDARVEPWKNSAWGVVQAFNTYNQHLTQVRGTNRIERSFLSAISGKTASNDTKVLQTLGTIVGKQLITV